MNAAGLESIYWVLTWLCHRSCAHCYDERFRPYRRDETERMLSESEALLPRIVANLPRTMQYEDGGTLHTGRIILAGGELLLDGVRERLLYPTLSLLRERYAKVGGVRLVIQTTGDVIQPEHLEALRRLGVWMVTVSGIDGFHKGLEEEAERAALTTPSGAYRGNAERIGLDLSFAY